VSHLQRQGAPLHTVRQGGLQVPIHIDIFHPDRIVVCTGRGAISFQEYERFVADLAKAGVLHYRKIIDVTAAAPHEVPREQVADRLMRYNAAFRHLAHAGRGPLAIVIDPRQTDVAHAFRDLTSSERPIEVFRSLHEARKWLAAFPLEN